MRGKSSSTDVIGRQVAAARELLGISQDELAQAVSIATSTLRRFENGQHSARPLTLKAIQNELERRHIEFLNDGGVGVFLRSQTTVGKAPKARE